MSASHDPVAERMVLACVLTGHPTAAKRFMTLPHDVWWNRLHETVATVLRDRIVRKVPINTLTVAADAEAVAVGGAMKGKTREFVIDTASITPPLESMGYYLDQMVLHHGVRRASAVADTLAQSLERTTSPESLAAAMDTAGADLERLRGGLTTTPLEPPISLQALLDREDDPYDWLVPDLLERGDRLILTGYEGTGKSQLVAQFGLTLAAGLHPFTGALEVDEGFRVLVLDCENGERQVRRRWRKMRDRVDGARDVYGVKPIDWSEQVRLEIRPEGIDLANPQEYARIEQVISLTAPDVVVGGPLYKMSKLDVRDEPAAKALIDALDTLRVKYNFCLIAEAHVGHVGETSGGRKLRPTGSSAFLRWPEFGYGIRGHSSVAHEEHPSLVEVVAWRGSRDERYWPSLLGHSRAELPWTPRDPAYRNRYGMGEWTPEYTDFNQGA